MVADSRGLLPLTDQQSAELHGGKNAHLQKHDVHLVRNIVSGNVVGKVSTSLSIDRIANYYY